MCVVWLAARNRVSLRLGETGPGWFVALPL
jgi:hypothetical protein